jgi:hypothetical protein
MNFLIRQDAKASFHTPEEIAAFKNRVMNPIDSGEYFLHSSHCEGCHGYDSAQVANIDESGNSVNLFDHWQSTMMANSARDPLWRAKVSHEILVNPAHAAALQDKCTSCHAPMGRYTSMYHGTAHYGLANLAVDSLGQDGVSCEGCHTIGTSVGQTFSGIIPYDTSRNVYGPFPNPFVGPMQLYEGYTPTYSSHMNQARICSSCHTLITETADTSGVLTGGIFVEQATYHEYLNSQFPADNITCQTCHMPHLEDSIIIANGFSNLLPRGPFNQHVFAGANSFMLTLIKNNKTSLGAGAEDWQFDTTIAATKQLLRQQSIVFDLQFDSLTNNTGYFTTRIQNKAGHKFPSGYPSRRAVLQLLVTDATGDTVFKSGTFTNDYHVLGETPSFEGHHDVISQPDRPQIYELVMGDVNGNFTSVLERAAIILKDNRIPPVGFTTASGVYDTVQISADALADPDFNKVNSVEGSGVDLVHFQVPVTGAIGNITVHANVFYQSVPPKWLEEMFMLNSPQIDTFRTMFNNADQTPLLIASDSLVNIDLAVGNNPGRENDLEVYPTISHDGKVFLKSSPGLFIKHIDIYSTEGKKINDTTFPENASSGFILLPLRQTVYLMKIQTTHQVFYRKVIRQ